MHEKRPTLSTSLDDLPVLTEMAGDRWGGDFGPLLADLFAAEDTSLMRSLDGSVLAFRNADLRALSANRDLGNLPAPLLAKAFEASAGAESDFKRLATNHVFTMNPPSHGPMRQVFARQFMPNKVDRFRPAAIKATRRSLAAASGRAEIDFLTDFSFRLTTSFWGELLGLSQAEVSELSSLVPHVSQAFSFIRTDEQTRLVERLAADYLALVSTGIQRSLDVGPPDYLAEMAAEFENAEVEKPDNLTLMLAATLLDGFHTMAFGLTNVVHALLTRPEQWRAVRSDPTLVPNAFHEGLRLAPPAVFTQRYALADVEHAGVSIPKGTPVTMFWLAGNRDPDVFPDPDEYDLARPVAGRTTFGGGIHLCPGRSVAKMVIETALAELVSPHIEVTVTGAADQWVPMSSMHELERLPVSIEAQW
jgi:cytochrome P450